jgi:hypothetical protein
MHSSNLAVDAALPTTALQEDLECWNTPGRSTVPLNGFFCLNRKKWVTKGEIRRVSWPLLLRIWNVSEIQIATRSPLFRAFDE